MLLLRFHLIGLNQRFTPVSLVVLLVDRVLWTRNKFGSIVDHLCLPKTTAASGKSFTIASADVLGGYGVAIVRPQNWANAT
jgi:hypothetical protein